MDVPGTVLAKQTVGVKNAHTAAQPQLVLQMAVSLSI